MNRSDAPVAGRNGVIVKPVARDDERENGYRSYEIYQRERVGESTARIKPRQLLSDEFRQDPYPYLAILREHYPCYRDWVANCYWITRYDDVTSIFADDANFESRPKAWYCGLEDYGRDFNEAPAVLEAEARCYDELTVPISEDLVGALTAQGEGDLIGDFIARLPLMLLCRLVGVPEAQTDAFCTYFWQAQRGASWRPELQEQGRTALLQLEGLIEPLLRQASAEDGDGLLAACLAVDAEATARDVVRTLLERDHQTLQGALGNLWFLLLTHPRSLKGLNGDPRLVKLAYLEALRHSPPVLSANRFARHEVERFGRLLPAGALLVCSAAAANRDPRIFADPDRFLIDRSDLAQREPRGHYRADGLASGISFGTGKPSRHPAVPENRPRSSYALVRDTAVAASMVLLEAAPGLRLAPDADPRLSALSLGEMHSCWRLPVVCG